MNDKRRTKTFPPYKRLRIVSEFAEHRKTAQEIAEKYMISRRTLFNWRDEFNNDYAALIGFYKFIVEDLCANGHRKAAEYLRDNAVDILTDSTGSKPPKLFDLSFGEIFDINSDKEGGEYISAQLEAFEALKILTGSNIT